MRPADVAALANVPVSQVRPVSLAEVQAALGDRLPADAFDALAAAPATFWQAGSSYYVDDEEWGEVVEITRLSYDRERGRRRGP